MTTKPKIELAPDSDLGSGKVLGRSRAGCAMEQVITALRSARRHGAVTPKASSTLPRLHRLSPGGTSLGTDRLRHQGYASQRRRQHRSAIRTAGEPCGHCGFFPRARPEAVIFRDGDLGLVDRKSRTVLASSDPKERMRWHSMLAYIAAERGYRPGWISHKYKQK